MKLGLGTAQFGGNYGIDGTRLSEETKSEILRTFLDFRPGQIIDTSDAYGDSLDFLGDHSQMINDADAKIVHKFRFKGRRALLNDIDRFNQTKIYCAMFHNGDGCINHPELIKTISRLRYQGRIDKIGASFYEPSALNWLIHSGFTPDVVQFPLSIFDHRFAGHLNRELVGSLISKGVEIHVRSIFLQGVLLADHKKLPPYFNQYKTHLDRFHQHCKYQKITPLQMCLDYVRSMKGIECAVIGAKTPEQIQTVITTFLKRPLKKIYSKAFRSPSLGLIDPRKWE